MDDMIPMLSQESELTGREPMLGGDKKVIVGIDVGSSDDDVGVGIFIDGHLFRLTDSQVKDIIVDRQAAMSRMFDRVMLDMVAYIDGMADDDQT